ncbi:MAG TPA: class I adenylate-forming enzyme family protein, partial [Polyangiales bacterium]|nr:class I adenylate-forming enzyme family protein [Polyangiales bacterium]
MVSEGDSERAQVGQALHQAALRWPERIAVCDAGSEGLEAQEITYAKLDAMARRAAAVLAARGVSAGDAVALCGENSPQLMAAWFGIVYAGAAAVPVPILSAVPEVQERVTHARCKWLVHDAARRELATQAAASLCLPLEALSDASVPPLAQPADTRALDTAMVLYTSGTTGKAKGAEISHASLSRHTAALCEHVLRLRAGDVVLCALPLTHSYGIRMAML